MQRKPPAECTDMTDVRSEIDRIDADLVALIAERFGYVDRAWQLKRAAGQEGAYVPWRIQQVIDRVRTLAADKGLPPEMVDMVGAQWRNMIGWFVQYEEEKLSKAAATHDLTGAGVGSGASAPSRTDRSEPPGGL